MTTFTCQLCLTEDVDIDGAFQPDCVEDLGTNHRYCFECVREAIRTITRLSVTTSGIVITLNISFSTDRAILPE